MAAAPSALNGLLDQASFVTLLKHAGSPSRAVSAGAHLRHLVPQGTPLQYLVYSTLLLSFILPFYHLVLSDYHAFLALGPGGTPSTFSGYVWVTFLKFFFARSDTYVPPALIPSDHCTPGFLDALPPRDGDRPCVAGIAPHRQVSQKGSPEMVAQLSKALQGLAASNPGLLSTGISCFEKNNLALFFSSQIAGISSAESKTNVEDSTLTAKVLRPRLESFNTPGSCNISPLGPEKLLLSPPLNPTCGHPAEITHLHTTEASMHLTLHPADAALVIENGWGERHPLAGRGPWVPRGFIMVYAPRTSKDLKVLLEIVKAGAWWVGGAVLKSG